MLHWLHWYGFSPIWVLIRDISWIFCEKALLHWLHWYGYSPLCVLKYHSRLLPIEKALSQWLHLNSFSPLWVLIWHKRLLLVEKSLAHWLHWYGLSPVCVLKWHICFLTIDKVLMTALVWFHQNVKCECEALLLFQLHFLVLTLYLHHWFRKHWYIGWYSSPLRFVWYITRPCFSVKVLSQYVHWCGFVPVWIPWCIKRFCLPVETLSDGCIGMVAPNCVSSIVL